MGVIDSTTNRFKCRDCGSMDSSKVVQRGSAYGGSWGSPSPCEGFEIQWKDSEFGEPIPTWCKCRKCGSINVERTSTM